jgi:hypothetical protein
MKKIVNILILFILISTSFSCKEQKKENHIIDELSIIKKLSVNNYFKNFLEYNIRTPREDGQYMIETNSIKEFWIHYDKKEGITLNKRDEESLNKELKTLYPNKYLEIKKKYVDELNKLVLFMNSNKIEYVVNYTSRRIDFCLENKNILSRIDDSAIQQSSINNFKRFYDTLIVVDSNWIILKNKKLR